MKGKIALEEHFATEEYLQDVKRYFIQEGAEVWERCVKGYWGWHANLGTQVLCLISSGIFDRCPKLQIVIGHMGEMLPIFLWRITNRCNTHKRDCMAELPINQYFQRNISIITSGNCNTPALMCAMMEMSTDRIMFSTDYPYESMKQAADWFDNIPFSDIDKMKMGVQMQPNCSS